MRTDLKEGMPVRSSDGKKLGKLISLRGETFLIEKGLFFKKDYECRSDDIQDIRDGDLILKFTEDDLKRLFAEEGAGLPYRGTEKRTSASMKSTELGGTEEKRIPLVEEELTAEKKVRHAGDIEITKDVTTERKEMSVPVVKEQVHVERVPVEGRTPAAGEASFKKESVSVPIREEEVEIKKRPVVREELRVSKQRQVEERRASEDVRKETADIEEHGDVKRIDPDKGGYHD